MQNFTELGENYEYDILRDSSYVEKESSDLHSVRQRCSKIWPTCDCNRQANVSKTREIIKNDGRYTICDIAKANG